MKSEMVALFEYGNWEKVTNIGSFKSLLSKIWSQRLFVGSEYENTLQETNGASQPYFQIDGDHIRANNFVGFVQNGADIIEIYPKVFRRLGTGQGNKEAMLRHVFYWLGYCRKWRFPFTKVKLEACEIDEFPELIINRIADQFLETVSKQPLTMYQKCEEALASPKGSINFKRYINNSFSKGKFQTLECDHEPFLFDNQVNRILKYCTRLLLNQTKIAENHRLLQETIFILDEVEDVTCSSGDIDLIYLNPFFEDYAELMDYCKIILNQQLYSSRSNDLSQWCLLFPMEYIFGDFLAGFLDSKFRKQWKIEYQKSDAYLSDVPRAFNIQHDIFLTSKDGSGRKIIIDSKYKIRGINFKLDSKKGVSQEDLYQVLSYAFKRGCSDVVLVYPNITEQINPLDKFEVISGFPGHAKVNVYVMEIPFWSFSDFKNLEMSLEMVVADALSQVLGE